MINLIGQSLSHFHLVEKLGESGMVTVYKGYDTCLERQVAAKVILPDQKYSENLLTCFCGNRRFQLNFLIRILLNTMKSAEVILGY